MSTEETQKAIRQVISILEKLLPKIEAKEPKPTFPESRRKLLEDGICLWCDQPLGESKATRGTHHSPCYGQIYKDHEQKIRSLDQTMAEGRLGPPGKSGRKRRERPPGLIGPSAAVAVVQASLGESKPALTTAEEDRPVVSKKLGSKKTPKTCRQSKEKP